MYGDNNGYDALTFRGICCKECCIILPLCGGVCYRASTNYFDLQISALNVYIACSMSSSRHTLFIW